MKIAVIIDIESFKNLFHFFFFVVAVATYDLFAATTNFFLN